VLPGTSHHWILIERQGVQFLCPDVATLSASRSRAGMLSEISPAELDAWGPTAAAIEYDALHGGRSK